IGLPSVEAGLVMPVPVPRSVCCWRVGAGCVGCCANASPVTERVSATADSTIRALDVIVVDLPHLRLAAGGTGPGPFRERTAPRGIQCGEDSSTGGRLIHCPESGHAEHTADRR